MPSSFKAPSEGAPSGSKAPFGRAPSSSKAPSDGAPSGSQAPSEGAPSGSKAPSERAPSERAPSGSKAPSDGAPSGYKAPSFLFKDVFWALITHHTLTNGLRYARRMNEYAREREDHVEEFRVQLRRLYIAWILTTTLSP